MENKMPFKPYKIMANKNLLGILMGNGFVVIDSILENNYTKEDQLKVGFLR